MSKNDNNPTPETIEVEEITDQPKRFKKLMVVAGTAAAVIGGAVLVKKLFGSDEENPTLDVNWVTDAVTEV